VETKNAIICHGAAIFLAICLVVKGGADFSEARRLKKECEFATWKTDRALKLVHEDHKRLVAFAKSRGLASPMLLLRAESYLEGVK